MTKLKKKVFLKKYNLKVDTMIGSEFYKVYITPIYPRDHKRTTDKKFVNLDKGSMGRSHWTCFSKKDNAEFYKAR